MDLAKIKSLIDLVSRSQVTELELTEGDTTLRLSRTASGPAPVRPGPVAPPPAAPSPLPVPPPETRPVADDAVRSPSFGVFHPTPSPDAPPFATLGAVVEAGQTLCLIEAMKVFTAVTAPRAGVVEAILVKAGEEVEAGQILFRLRA